MDVVDCVHMSGKAAFAVYKILMTEPTLTEVFTPQEVVEKRVEMKLEKLDMIQRKRIARVHKGGKKAAAAAAVKGKPTPAAVERTARDSEWVVVADEDDVEVSDWEIESDGCEESELDSEYYTDVYSEDEYDDYEEEEEEESDASPAPTKSAQDLRALEAQLADLQSKMAEMMATRKASKSGQVASRKARSMRSVNASASNASAASSKSSVREADAAKRAKLPVRSRPSNDKEGPFVAAVLPPNTPPTRDSLKKTVNARKARAPVAAPALVAAAPPPPPPPPPRPAVAPRIAPVKDQAATAQPVKRGTTMPNLFSGSSLDKNRLRKVDGNRSPGGTPVRKLPHREPTSAQDILAQALMKKFNKVNADLCSSPESPGSDSSSFLCDTDSENNAPSSPLSTNSPLRPRRLY